MNHVRLSNPTMFNLVYRKPNLKRWKLFSDVDEEITEQIVLAHVFGISHESAIFINDSDEVYALGSNYSGRLGIEGIDYLNEPQTIHELCFQQVLGICTGRVHALAYTAEGKLYSWGSNSDGQLGVGNNISSAIPLEIFELHSHQIVNIAAGSRFSLALSSTHEIWQWGNLTPAKDSVIPVKIEIPCLEGNIAYISCGWSHAVALGDNGKVFTWGIGDNGKLGHDNCRSLANPKQIEKLDNSIIKVACGKDATIAINQLGEIYTWGNNADGCLSVDKSKSYITSPTKIHFREPITDIAGSIYHQIFAAENISTGNIFVWGSCEGKVKYISPISLHCTNLFDVFCDMATPLTVRSELVDEVNSEIEYEDTDYISIKDYEIRTEQGKVLAERRIPLEMFNNQEMSDIVIKLQNHDIHAHKVILNYFSEHFRSMFQEQWKEITNGVIDMTNYNTTAYQTYIKFIYSGIMAEIPTVDLFDLYLIAMEYKEIMLANECLSSLNESICVKNVAFIFASAFRNKCQEVMDMCIKASAQHFDDVILTEGFAQFTNEERLSFCQLTATTRKHQNLNCSNSSN